MPCLTFDSDELVEIIRDYAQRTTGMMVQKTDVTISVEPSGTDDHGHRVGPPYSVEANVAVRLRGGASHISMDARDPFYG